MGADLSGAGNAGQRTGTSNGVCFHLIMDTNINFESEGKVQTIVKEQGFAPYQKIKKTKQTLNKERMPEK